MDYVLDRLPVWLLVYWQQLTPGQLWLAANTLAAACFILVLYFSYYCFRRGLGYTKFKGRWYGAEDTEKLKQELYSGVREGRLPDSETMRFLDRHVYGRKGSEMRNLSGRGWL